MLLFGSKASFSSATYEKYFDLFASKITDKSAYNGITLNNEDTYYVIEYNNSSESPSQLENYGKHEIAIYNATDKTIKYYKLNGSTYEEVTEDGTLVNS